jgi:thiol-disulfide isomerase/thioredoxin
MHRLLIIVHISLYFFTGTIWSASYAPIGGNSLTIHLRGVYDSSITLLALTANGTFRPVMDASEAENGKTAILEITKEQLPGEFVLRFDYREKPSSTPYPCEKRIFIGSQYIELWVNPKYCNNPDSTYFQPGEQENSIYTDFAGESYRRKEQLGLLRQLLMNYDDRGSKFYKQAVRVDEARRREFNEWLEARKEEDSILFVSKLYMFEYVPETNWGGTERERLISIIDHYFDGVDLSDPALARTSHLTGWIDTYVNLHGQMATTVTLRDSLFTEAARKAIGQAKRGHPEVYGWMVDYFYRGFEINDIPSGIKMLEPYLDDPACLTSKRKEIERRLKGMKTLVAGTRAPEIEIVKTGGSLFSLYSLSPSTPYLLLFFWSAGCVHCKEIIETIYHWQQQADISRQLSVVAISLDETGQETALWQELTERYSNWMHLRATEGVRSNVAADYFILSTPQMILLDSVTKEIIDLPRTPQALADCIHKAVLTLNN